MELRRLGSLVLVALQACTGDGVQLSPTQLSEEAQPIFELMRWDGTGVPPTSEEAATLVGVDPVADAEAIEAAVRALAGDVFASSSFDPLQGRLLVDTIERDILPGPDLTDEQALRDGVTSVVTAIGAAADQILLEIGGTTVGGGAPGEDPSPQALDKTVYITRPVLGLRLDDGGTASFEMDGPLISMHCKWRRFDYDASTLSVEGLTTEDAVMAALAEHLVADGFEVEPTTTAIDVGAHYWAVDPVDPSSDIWTLRLVGYAAVIDSRGGSIPTHAFYLDDGTSLSD
jgi:hypothetical protein